MAEQYRHRLPRARRAAVIAERAPSARMEAARADGPGKPADQLDDQRMAYLSGQDI